MAATSGTSLVQVFTSSRSSEGWTKAQQRDFFSSGFLVCFGLWLAVAQSDPILFLLWIKDCQKKMQKGKDHPSVYIYSC